MAARRTAKVRLEGEDALTPTVKKAETSTQKLFSSIRKGGVAAFAAWTAAIAGATAALRRVFTATTAAEDATNKLNQAVQNAGGNAETAAAGFDTWANAVQASTTASADQAKELAALAIAYGAPLERATEFVDVALNFAAATGKAAPEALIQLTRTLGGFAGELGEVNPQVRALTKAQLEAGEAAKILGEQFAGQAAAQADTLTGALAQLGNQIDATIAAVINAAGGTGTLTEKIQALTAALRQSAVVKALALELRVLATVLGGLVKIVTTLTDALGKLIAFGIKPFLTSQQDVIDQGARWEDQAERNNLTVTELTRKVQLAQVENELYSRTTAEVVAAQKAAAATTETLTDKTEDLVEAETEQAAATVQAVEAFDEYAVATERVIVQQQRLAVSAQAASAAVAQSQAVASGGRGSTVSTSTERTTGFTLGGGSFSQRANVVSSPNQPGTTRGSG